MSNPKDKHGQVTVLHASQTVWSGPVPPPDVLAQYDKALPGAMDRILTMAESESAHRRKMDELAILEQTESRKEIHAIHRHGQTFAFSVVVLSFIGAIICVRLDSQLVGGLLVGSTLVAIVSGFLEKRASDSPAKNG